MSKAIVPGWYPDPVEQTVQRYWDGEQWVGEAIPVDATPPSTPPASPPPPPADVGGADAPAVRGTGARERGAEAAEDAQGRPPSRPARPAPPRPDMPPHPPSGMPPGVRPGTQTLVHGMPLAPISARFMARFVDILAVTGLNIVVNGWFVYQWWLEFAPIFAQVQRWTAGQVDEMPVASDRAAELQWAMILVGLGLWCAYEVPSLAFSGQTLGRRLFHVKVLGYDGKAPGFRASFFRWFFLSSPIMLFPCLAPVQIADYLWCAWDRPLQQCLHDKFGRTIVVHATPEDRPADQPKDPDGALPSDRQHTL